MKPLAPYVPLRGRGSENVPAVALVQDVQHVLHVNEFRNHLIVEGRQKEK